MANHKSAKKRNIQNEKRNLVNKALLSKIKNNSSRFNELIKAKDTESVKKTFSLLNSSLAKALKRGLIKKNYVSRKLSSLSNQLKKIQ